MRNKCAKVSDPLSFVSCPGSDDHILYESKLLPTGEIRLTPCGKESISQKINAQRQFTDISFIMQRLSIGDTSVLRDGAMYGDFTKVPKTLAESLQVMIDGRRKFELLPLEIRNKFNNSYEAWIMQTGSRKWIEDMSPIFKKPESKIDDKKVNVANES